MRIKYTGDALKQFIEFIASKESITSLDVSGGVTLLGDIAKLLSETKTSVTTLMFRIAHEDEDYGENITYVNDTGNKEPAGPEEEPPHHKQERLKYWRLEYFMSKLNIHSFTGEAIPGNASIACKAIKNLNLLITQYSDIEELANYLSSSTPSLENLTINIELDDEEDTSPGELILRSLKENKSLTRLSCIMDSSEQGINDTDAVVEAFQANKTLTYLKLGYMELPLPAILTQNTTIQSLELIECKVNDKFVQNLCKSWKAAKCPLREIHIIESGNECSVASLVAILEANETVQSLETLIFSRCLDNKPKKVFAKLLNLLPKNTSLTRLAVDLIGGKTKNKIVGVEFYHRIAHALPPQIRCLGESGHRNSVLGVDHVKILLEGLAKAPALQELHVTIGGEEAIIEFARSLPNIPSIHLTIQKQECAIVEEAQVLSNECFKKFVKLISKSESVKFLGITCSWSQTTKLIEGISQTPSLKYLNSFHPDKCSKTERKKLEAVLDANHTLTTWVSTSRPRLLEIESKIQFVTARNKAEDLLRFKTVKLAAPEHEAPVPEARVGNKRKGKDWSEEDENPKKSAKK